MAEKPQSVTSIEVSPEQERKGRILRYTVAMSVRMVCVVLMFFVQGWLLWVAAAGAIFLPYFAVVIANAQGAGAKKSNSAAPVVAKPLVISAQEFVAASKNDSIVNDGNLGSYQNGNDAR